MQNRNVVAFCGMPGRSLSLASIRIAKVVAFCGMPDRSPSLAPIRIVKAAAFCGMLGGQLTRPASPLGQHADWTSTGGTRLRWMLRQYHLPARVLTLINGLLVYLSMEEKTCSKCKRSQPISEFYRNRRWRDGMHPWCKSCFNAAGKARYEKRCFAHPPAYRWNRDLIRHHYFADVTTPMQAYLLGFLAADGNVLAPQNRISIELSVKDRDLLTLIRDELAPGHQIRTRTRTASPTRYSSGESCVVAFSSSHMVADLARFGIVPAKTHTLRWPDVLPQNLARDFLLGYFDGDGHVTHTVNFGHRYAIWGLASGAPDFLRDIIEVVRTQTGINLGGPYARGSKTYAVRITGKRALEMDEWLHQNGLGLARKRCTCP